MKTNRFIIALSVLAAVISCNKAERLDQPQAEGDLVTITATMPEDVVVKGAGIKTSLSWTWNAGDKITVIGQTTEIFKIKEGFSSKKAEFVGKAVKGTSFTILYPGEEANTTDWNAQVQKDNNSLDHLKYQACLSGVDEYTTFAFNPEWAEAHGGTLKQVGVLKLSLEIPGSLTKPDSVKVNTEAPLFYTGNAEETASNSITLHFNDVTVSDSTLVAWLNTSWNDGIFAAGTTVSVVLYGQGKIISRDFTLSKESAIKTGYVNLLTIKGRTWADEAANLHYAGGKGTEAAPWIIKTAEQLRCLAGDLVPGSTRYVKLEENIDLTGGADWVPLNNASPYDKRIDFDGNGKTITGLTITADVAYPSFAGVLYGSIKDVTFEGANIDGNANNTGVVAGYIGTGSYEGTCSGVTVNNATVKASNKNVGAFAGVVAAAKTISNCHVTGTNTVTQTATATGCCAGGFVGSMSVAATFTNCTAKANVTNEASYYTGGFIGQISSAVAAKFTSCAYLGGTITAGRNATGNSPVAGFVGRVPKNAAATFTGCYVDGASVTATKSGRVGGFVGDAGDKNTVFTSCYVKNSNLSAAQHLGGFVGTYGTASKCYVETTTLTANNANTGGFAGYPENSVFSDCYAAASVTVNGGTFNAVGGFMGICKGGATITNCFAASAVSGTGTGVGGFIGTVDAAPTSITKCIGWNATLPFYGSIKTAGIDANITGNYAGAEGTISAQATTLGWSTDIWDLSGDTPKLK